jgi:hypothetical protein
MSIRLSQHRSRTLGKTSSGEGVASAEIVVSVGCQWSVGKRRARRSRLVGRGSVRTGRRASPAHWGRPREILPFVSGCELKLTTDRQREKADNENDDEDDSEVR